MAFGPSEVFTPEQLALGYDIKYTGDKRPR